MFLDLREPKSICLTYLGKSLDSLVNIKSITEFYYKFSVFSESNRFIYVFGRVLDPKRSAIETNGKVPDP